MSDEFSCENVGLKLKLEQMKVRERREAEKKKKERLHQKLKRWGVASVSVFGLLGVGYFGYEQWTEYKAKQNVFDTVIVPTVKQVESGLEEVVEGHVGVARKLYDNGGDILVDLKDGYVELGKKASKILKEHPCGDDHINYDFITLSTWKTYTCRVPDESEIEKCYGLDRTRYTLCEGEKELCCPPKQDVVWREWPVDLGGDDEEYKPKPRVFGPKVKPVSLPAVEKEEQLEIVISGYKKEYGPGDTFVIFYQLMRGEQELPHFCDVNTNFPNYNDEKFNFRKDPTTSPYKIVGNLPMQISCDLEQKTPEGEYYFKISCADKNIGKNVVNRVRFNFKGYNGANCEREKKEAEEEERKKFEELHMPRLSYADIKNYADILNMVPFKPKQFQSGDVCLENCLIKAYTNDPKDVVKCTLFGDSKGFETYQIFGKDSLIFFKRSVDALEQKNSFLLRCITNLQQPVLTYAKDFSIQITLDRRLDILKRLCDQNYPGYSGFARECVESGAMPKTVELCSTYFSKVADKINCVKAKTPEYVFTECQKSFSGNESKSQLLRCIQANPPLGVLQSCTNIFSLMYDRINCVESKPSILVARACASFPQHLNTNDLMVCMKYAKTQDLAKYCMSRSDPIDCFKYEKK